MYSIVDGNNRINALIAFNQTPLKYLADLNQLLYNNLISREGGQNI
jgi:hypothetical protein